MQVFDTSAIIAAHVRDHEQFTWASDQLARADAPALCAHSLAECSAVMTASPQFRYTPDDLARFLRFLEQSWTVLPLTPAHSLRAAERCRDLGEQGGAIYDTLLAKSPPGGRVGPRHPEPQALSAAWCRCGAVGHRSMR